MKRRGADTVFVCSGGVSGQITLPQAWPDRGEPPAAAAAEGLAGLDTRPFPVCPGCFPPSSGDECTCSGPSRAAGRTLTEQGRRCGRPGCRCADGEPHGPYAYFTPRPAGRGRARYVPAALAGVVRRYLRRGTEVEAVLAEISAINAELLARRELR